MKRLDEIEARADAATEGPWRYVSIPEHGGFVEDRAAHDIFTWLEDDAGTIGATGGDAEFIAHARQDVPALVAALRAVVAIHRPVTVPGEVFGTWGEAKQCEDCEQRWPCNTLAAIRQHLGGGD